MTEALHAPSHYKRRLNRAIADGLAGRAAEAYVFATTDLAAVPAGERGRLKWICESMVWPVTRRRPPRRPNPTPTFTFEE